MRCVLRAAREPVAARGWARRLSDTAKKVDEGFFDPKGARFADLPLHETLQSSLAARKLERLSHVQALALPRLLNGRRDVIIGAETGTGKTLAFAVPLMDWVLKARDHLRAQAEQPPAPLAPRNVVLTPNQALCDQVAAVMTEMLPRKQDLKVGTITGVAAIPRRPLDVLVTTPLCLAGNLSDEMISHLNTVVFDEVDMLLTSHFRDTSSLIRRLRLAEHRPRFVFAAATLPARGLKSVRKYLEDRFPDAELVTTGGMHSYRLAVAQEFRELPDDSLQTRLNALRSLLQEIKRVPEQPHVLVFVNSVDSAKRALEWLQGESIEAVGFHRDVPEVERAAVLERARSAERPLCIIATDMASRGLDLPLVGHVVQLEFAENVVDHIHRVGRTGRAALGGVAIGFYSRAQLPLIDAIRAGGVYAPDSTFSRKRQFRKRLRRVAEAMSRGEIEPQAVSF